MKTFVTIPAVMMAGLFLAACSDSPRDRFADMCQKSEAECSCVADYLDSNLEEDEFSALMDEIEGMSSKAEEKKVLQRLMRGELVSERVSKTFIQSTKACGS